LIHSSGDIPCRGLENGDLDIAFMCAGGRARYYFEHTGAKGGLASVVEEQGMVSRPDKCRARNTYPNTLAFTRLDHRCLQR